MLQESIFVGMNDYVHISLPHFLDVIEKRLGEYREALFGTRQSFGMENAMLTSRLHNMQTLRQLIAQNKLTNGDFWGYGINHISDGVQEYSSIDVEVIKRTGGLNKHHEPFRNFMLLMFKVENNAFWVSTFVIDTCSPKINSSINSRFSLSIFEHARMRTIGQDIFVDIYFKGIGKPVSFQIETYHLARNYFSNQTLASYYIGQFEKLDNVPVESNSLKSATKQDRLKFANDTTSMLINGLSRLVLFYLYKQRGDKGNIYGNISANTGLHSAKESEDICTKLYAAGLAEWRDNRVFITESGRLWVEKFYEDQDDKIREFVYDDYDFALLRFLYEQEIPIKIDDFPEILMDEAPKLTTGYPSMNLHHMLEIEFRKYIDNPMNKYELNKAGRKYFEHLAKKKNFTFNGLNAALGKKNNNNIFISYSHANKQWLEKVQTHLKALKNYGQIEFDYWDDTKLISGDKWEETISHELDRAGIAILIISTDFFASDFIKAKELAPLLKNAEIKGTRIMPLIISHSIFKTTSIAQFQAVNDPLHPLDSLAETEQNKILVKMCDDIGTHMSVMPINK